mmetsp:Transcript_2824/g.10487  ORF Transcript_2824/g.10487 Transcript_2824/m.10487 type:complete len:192 (-) Transcript_2824:56-631(-)
MECLASVAAVGWNARSAASPASPPVTRGSDRFGGPAGGFSGGLSGSSRRMSLEFLRSYSNASPTPARARFSDPGSQPEDGRGGGDSSTMGSIAEKSSTGGTVGHARDDEMNARREINAGWEERRERVRAMLERARVPVHVSASTGAERVPGAAPLVVMGCARVAYPFTADAVECANEIVLARVRELVSTVQ